MYKNLARQWAVDRALAEFGGITRTRLLEELASIAFSDIRKVVTWNQEPEHNSLGDLSAPEKKKPVTKLITSRVTVLPAATMDPRVAAAVASVQQGARGVLKVKMHDRIAAIDKLARALGMFQDRVDVTANGEPIIPILIYTGAPDKILGRRAENPSPPEVVSGDGEESD
jgi:hypothetical protein